MPPDFLLRCPVCGSETVWDTETCPPVGSPEIGHPVLWRCEACDGEQRHVIVRVFIILDKLHHEICLATEIDRPTVNRVMTEMDRCRRPRDATASPPGADAAEVVARRSDVPRALVEAIVAAETAWLRRRGYLAENAPRA
jgi:hypothetical protein